MSMGNMRLLILLIPFLSFNLIQGQEIISTGQHASEEFLWAVGVDNLSFSTSLSGVTSENYANYTYDWSHISVDGDDLVSFRIEIAELDRVLCYYGNDSNNSQNVSANGIEYRIDCSLVDSTLESQFTIVSSLNDFYSGSTLEVVGSVVNNTKELRIEYCANLEENDHLKISGGKKAEFDDVARYTCSESALVVNNIYDKNVNTYSRTCKFDAKWSGQGSDVDCWFAPEVSVKLEQNGIVSNGPLVSENNCTIHCEISAQGNPADGDVIYYYGTEIINNTFYVTSDDNGADLSCQMVNNYVNDVDSSAGFSSPIFLDVLYRPEPVNGSLNDSQSTSTGQGYNITVRFNANPRLNLSDTTLLFAENVLNSSNARISYNGTLHVYQYELPTVTSNSFGIYALRTTSPSPELLDRITIFFVNLTSVDEVVRSLNCKVAASILGFLFIVELLTGIFAVKVKIEVLKKNPAWGVFSIICLLFIIVGLIMNAVKVNDVDENSDAVCITGTVIGSACALVGLLLIAWYFAKDEEEKNGKPDDEEEKNGKPDGSCESPTTKKRPS